MKIAFVRENIVATQAIAREYWKIASMQDETEATNVV